MCAAVTTMLGIYDRVCGVDVQYGFGLLTQVSCSQDDQEFDEMPDFGEHVEKAIFEQILEMDESEEERDFSAPLVLNFFEQATETFDEMQTAL